LGVWIEASPENAAKMVKALEQFGFGTLGLQAADFLVLNQTIQLGYPPNRVDLLSTLVGVEFETCYAARVRVDIDGLGIDFIDRENLKKNKKAVGRAQDLADIESLS
jgi:hypothetical protein